MSASEVAREAAGIIERGGLCKGILRNEQGEHCWVGALSEVRVAQLGCGIDLYGDPVWNALLSKGDEIAQRHGVHCGVLYNNHPDTTAEDIILLLKQTAYELEETSS